MKTFDHFFEDIAARQALLKQRQKDQAVAYKKKAAVATSASRSDLTQRSADAGKRANSALEAAAQRRKSIACRVKFRGLAPSFRYGIKKCSARSKT